MSEIYTCQRCGYKCQSAGFLRDHLRLVSVTGSKAVIFLRENWKALKVCVNCTDDLNNTIDNILYDFIKSKPEDFETLEQLEEKWTSITLNKEL